MPRKPSSTLQELHTPSLNLLPIRQSYRRFGIFRENGATTYREWAPAAQNAALFGDFSNWQEVKG